MTQKSTTPSLTVLALIMLFAAPATSFAALDIGTEQALARRRTPVVEAYERARNAVVNIATTEKVEVNRWGISMFGEIFSVPSEREERSVGSGVIIHEDGYIVTNAHVIRLGAKLTVTLVNGQTYEAQVIGKDAERDLAVIKIAPPSPLSPVALGRSDDLLIGETTIAVGNPVGLQNTVTTGVISAINRELHVGGNLIYQNVIQTDASINPGNSGGALLNINGQLIGINTAIRTDAQNIGFAIPVDMLRELLPEILSCENLNKVQVGLRVSGATPGRVVQIREGSPAEVAGLKLGDVIKTVNGEPFVRDLDLYIDLLSCDVGDAVRLQVERDGKTVSANMKLTPVPRPDGVRLAEDKLGMTIANIKEDVARSLPRGYNNGVIVMSVAPRGPAHQGGIQPGDVLIAVGRYYVKSVEHLGALLSDVSEDDPIDFDVLRITHRGMYSIEGRMYAR